MECKDTTTSVSELRQIVREFVDERAWQVHHRPKNLAMSLAIEAAELMEHFQWQTLEESQSVRGDATRLGEITDELADCLSYVLAMANALDIDLTDALEQKMVKNRLKYPPPESTS